MKKNKVTKILILGSKEYPLGSNKGEDKITSGGYERYTEDFIEELRKNRKLHITIITRKFRGAKDFEMKGNVEIHRVKWLNGFYFRNVSFNLMSFLKAINLEFDAIIAHGVFASFFGFCLKKIKGGNIKLVSRPGGIASTQPQYAFVLRNTIGILEKYTYKMADEIVFLSDEEKATFHQKLHFLPKKHVVIPTGVNIFRFKIGEKTKKAMRKSFGLDGSNIVVSFIGRLNKVKGAEYLIEAVKSIDDPNLRCLIVGEGPEKIYLKNMAKTDKRIVFTGHRTDVPEILSITDIFALPSLSEGLPISLLEAMASGCACIATDIGLPVTDGKNAVLVDAGDSESFREGLERLIENKSLRKEMGKANLKDAAEKRSWKKVVASYMKLF